MRHLNLVLTLVVLLCGASYLKAELETESVYVHYSFPKAVYLTAEPVFVSASCTNYGPGEFRFDLDDLWRIDVMDAAGNKLPFRGRLIRKHYFPRSQEDGMPSDHKIPLLPGATIELGSSCVTDEYGNGEGGFDLYLPPGSYRVCSRGYLSDTAVFSVADPRDSVELRAMKELTSAIDHRFEKLASYEKIFGFYSDFYRRFPEAVYAQRALRVLANLFPSYTPGLTDSLQQRYTREFIRRFPESGYNCEIVGVFKPDFVPDKERQTFAKTLQTLRSHLTNLQQRALVDGYVARLQK